ncbi:MAG: ATP-binding cassette domain-containing protein [Clostridiales bacterium]|jgi:energy-coupling factor transport system ATP-binding protein|nr:ATP-binding cassette domain-containing protein [Clostridiales bacterium]
MDIFTISGLTFNYPERPENALDNISFSVRQGEFLTVAGPSGCGKSTLLRHLKPTLAPHGVLRGEILFENAPLSDLDLRKQSSSVGFVCQDPDSQIVTDKVWHELAFGLESLGYDTPMIRGRVAEISSFFGVQTCFYKNVSELSGGQKQLLNLASIMVMQPSALILDEPTSQLDPIAASEFLATVAKINRELGVTVIITEHRLEEVLPISDRAIIMNKGKIICDGAPAEVGENLRVHGNGMFFAMPTPMRVFAVVSGAGRPCSERCPVTVRDGRLWLDDFARLNGLSDITSQDLGDSSGRGDPAVTLENVWFKYKKDAPDVLRGLSFKAYGGELLAILGGNGTGKTTTLSVISGVNKPYRGKILIEDRSLASARDPGAQALCALPQNAQALFVKKTVREDLQEILNDRKPLKDDKIQMLAYVVRLCQLDELLERHPYDLSGGERQRAALAKVLLLNPRILLLDEPTKGLDAEFKRTFAEILKNLSRRGVTVIMVSHDIEFCALYAHRCALFFDGSIVTEAAPRAFFSGKSFYTTSANRMARHLLPNAVTAEDLIEACGATTSASPCNDEVSPLIASTAPPLSTRAKASSRQVSSRPKPLPVWRQTLAVISGGAALALAIIAVIEPWAPGAGPKYLPFVFLAAFFTLCAAVNRRGVKRTDKKQTPVERRDLSKRYIAAAAIILLAIPLTIFTGVFWLGDRKYYFISILVALETITPFFLMFEGKKPRARELVVIAALCALGVAGRTASFMLPQFKPVAAMVIISGVALGGESGFLVGAVTMLASNALYGHGPWTPWQMFAMGLIGFLAGALFRKGILRRSRPPLCIFGGLAVVVIYGGIMNPSLVIQYNDHPTWGMILTAYLTGFPFDLIHAAATIFFLWILSPPMLEKLDRVKVKYGLTER